MTLILTAMVVVGLVCWIIELAMMTRKGYKRPGLLKAVVMLAIWILIGIPLLVVFSPRLLGMLAGLIVREYRKGFETICN